MNAKKSSNNPFNSNQTNTQSASNPHLPSGFPELLPPLDQQQLKQNDDLITQGDAIIAKMDALIATIDLPAIKLSDSEKTQLDAQRQIQQTQIEDIKAQLEALQGGLQ
ncbi:hypothetical protein SPONL_1263 [uncultured Candidatus Thioglobus sp.]|nr:hypothetical protein SPONL_1263 [uncultured Candidatus Thioglobus sp.]